MVVFDVWVVLGGRCCRALHILSTLDPWRMMTMLIRN